MRIKTQSDNIIAFGVIHDEVMREYVCVCVRARYRRLIVFEMFNTLRRFYCGILRGPHVALNCVWGFFFF